MFISILQFKEVKCKHLRYRENIRIKMCTALGRNLKLFKRKKSEGKSYKLLRDLRLTFSLIYSTEICNTVYFKTYKLQNFVHDIF